MTPGGGPPLGATPSAAQENVDFQIRFASPDYVPLQNGAFNISQFYENARARHCPLSLVYL